MAYVPVPNDLNRIKTKLAFNLTKRQLICFSIAGGIGVPFYLFTRSHIGNSIALFLIPPGKRVKRGRLLFAEKETIRQDGQTSGAASGQPGPKPQSTGKFKQDEEREQFSSRLQRNEPHERADNGQGKTDKTGADSRRKTAAESGMEGNREKKAESKAENRGEESHASKERKSGQEKKLERAQTKAEYSSFRLERAKNRLAAQKPYKPPGLAKRTATAAGTSAWS